MKPKSGGGKVETFDLKRKAEALGAEVFLIGGPEPVDVAEVARQAVASGAVLLGVAGSDGTQALVAGIAAEHGLPFVVISAGTRNHFALDLGLDRQDPSACLGALSDGVELRGDLGMINGRTFVHDASFGAYAEIVQNPAYRDDKRKHDPGPAPGHAAKATAGHGRALADGTDRSGAVANHARGRQVVADDLHPARGLGRAADWLSLPGSGRNC